MRIKFDNLIICSSLLLVALPAYAVTEAGEVQRKEEHTPHMEMYVTNNIANLDVDAPQQAENEEIKFSADELINDDKAGTITATGDVEIEYNGMRLVTDKLTYDQNSETITADGNVKLYTSDGSLIISDKASLADNLSVGEMHNIKVYLKDKSLVTAKSFRRKGNQTKTLTHATYTACDFCEGIKPLWEVNARKIQ
ncbi:MAG: LptA/OstA family protein, partial [Alphaproteobacteria bacterium]